MKGRSTFPLYTLHPTRITCCAPFPIWRTHDNLGANYVFHEESMKSQKTTMMLLLCVLAVQMFAQIAVAQEPPSPDKQEAIAKLEKLSSELQLTPQQKKQMLPIMMEEGKKMKAIK